MIKHRWIRTRRPSRPLGEDLRRPVVTEQREEQREEDSATRYGWDADGREVPADG